MLTVADDSSIRRIGTLLNNVILDEGSSTGRKIDAVAGATPAVDDTVVLDRRDCSPTFDLVPNYCVVDIAVGDRKTSDPVDIDVVGLTVAVAIVGKLAVVDVYAAARNGRAEYSLLIIVEIGVGNREIAALISYSLSLIHI